MTPGEPAALRVPKVALVLSGGVGLGAYQAGAFRALEARFAPGHIAAASIGAVNGAIVAGNAPGRRADALDAFWNAVATTFPAPFPGAGEDFAPGQPWRRAASWAGAIQSRLAGRPGLFSPQIPAPVLGPAALGLYTLAPLARMLERFVDFGRLNAGEIRLSVLATDLATGEPVFFDTGRGQTIGPEHVLASCGFVPEFAPTEIDGRLLGDGGLAANAPLEAAFEDLGPDEDVICFVLDLFARDVGPPRTLAEAGALRRDLLFCNPTHRALEALRREDALRRRLAEAGGGPAPAEARRGATAVLHLSHLPASGEAGVERHFDFSRTSLDARRRAGAEDMARALDLLGAPAPPPGFTLHRVRR